MSQNNQKRILVVDDEVDLRDLLADLLEEEGFHIAKASSGREAIEFLKSNSVDYVLSDIRMPNGDGVFLLENVQKLPPPQPSVIFMTGFAEINRDEALKKGALELFHKPTNTQKIVDLIQNREKD